MKSVEVEKDSPPLKHGSTYYCEPKQAHPHLSCGGPSGEKLHKIKTKNAGK